MENPQRLNVQSQPEKLEAQWVVGFVDGEGCFYVGINPRPRCPANIKYSPNSPSFSIDVTFNCCTH